MTCPSPANALETRSLRKDWDNSNAMPFALPKPVADFLRVRGRWLRIRRPMASTIAVAAGGWRGQQFLQTSFADRRHQNLS